MSAKIQIGNKSSKIKRIANNFTNLIEMPRKSNQIEMPPSKCPQILTVQKNMFKLETCYDPQLNVNLKILAVSLMKRCDLISAALSKTKIEKYIC